MNYDRSFQEALDDLRDRLALDIKSEIEKRIPLIHEQTVEEATRDIANPEMRVAVADMLKYLQVETYLRLLEEHFGIISFERSKELRDYVAELHIAYMNRKRQNQ